MKDKARQAAFSVLFKIQNDKAFSNLALDSALGKLNIEQRDKAFVSALVYGTLERTVTIDYVLSSLLSKPLKSLHPKVLCILRLGVFQILFSSKIPDSAAVNESVSLAKQNGVAFVSSLINAVLRNCSRKGLVLPNESNKALYISVKYSCPLWLTEKWLNEYGEEDTVGILSSSLEAGGTVIRVNTTKTSASKLLQSLNQKGFECEIGLIEDSIVIKSMPHGIEQLEEYSNGLFHVQGYASQLCSKALGAKRGDTVFDLCSAPGGKTFTIAQLIENSGKILAFDIYPNRVKLIENGANRLSLSCVSASVGDASEFNSELGMADCVLCDAPCSGLGIIGKKPEIKYKDPTSLKDLPPLQFNILSNAARYVKIGGRLVYSTCTLNKNENEQVCERFLSEHKDFKPRKPFEHFSDECFVTLMPHKNNCDGFFVALFERIG